MSTDATDIIGEIVLASMDWKPFDAIGNAYACANGLHAPVSYADEPDSWCAHCGVRLTSTPIETSLPSGRADDLRHPRSP